MPLGSVVSIKKQVFVLATAFSLCFCIETRGLLPRAVTHNVLFSPKAGTGNPYVSPTLKMQFSPTIPYVPL